MSISSNLRNMPMCVCNNRGGASEAPALQQGPGNGVCKAVCACGWEGGTKRAKIIKASLPSGVLSNYSASYPATRFVHDVDVHRIHMDSAGMGGSTHNQPLQSV